MSFPPFFLPTCQTMCRRGAGLRQRTKATAAFVRCLNPAPLQRIIWQQHAQSIKQFENHKGNSAVAVRNTSSHMLA